LREKLAEKENEIRNLQRKLQAELKSKGEIQTKLLHSREEGEIMKGELKTQQ